jgi:hypothetical protein
MLSPAPSNIISGCSWIRDPPCLRPNEPRLNLREIGYESCARPQRFGIDFGRATTRLPQGRAGDRMRRRFRGNPARPAPINLRYPDGTHPSEQDSDPG